MMSESTSAGVLVFLPLHLGQGRGGATRAIGSDQTPWPFIGQLGRRLKVGGICTPGHARVTLPWRTRSIPRTPRFHRAFVTDANGPCAQLPPTHSYHGLIQREWAGTRIGGMALSHKWMNRTGMFLAKALLCRFSGFESTIQEVETTAKLRHSCGFQGNSRHRNRTATATFRKLEHVAL